jgi:NAD(P)-dependent dehydrogenase (short-subunit alcohol dehydrogenase family)
VNTVAPGITDTGKIGWLLDDTELLTSTKAAAALDRVGQPEDIADVVAFLASDDASRFTGHLLDATGGGFLGPRMCRPRGLPGAQAAAKNAVRRHATARWLR